MLRLQNNITIECTSSFITSYIQTTNNKPPHQPWNFPGEEAVNMCNIFDSTYLVPSSICAQRPTIWALVLMLPV